jgi:hypothetical protein
MLSKISSRLLQVVSSLTLLVLVFVGASTASAFQNGTPKAPAIIEIQSIKSSGGMFNLKITLSVHQGTSQLRPLSSVVTAGGKTCTIPRGNQTCTIRNFKKSAKISASAVTKNINGTSAKSLIVSYTVGTAKKSYKATNTTTAPKATTPQTGGGYVGGYSIKTAPL